MAGLGLFPLSLAWCWGRRSTKAWFACGLEGPLLMVLFPDAVLPLVPACGHPLPLPLPPLLAGSEGQPPGHAVPLPVLASRDRPVDESGPLRSNPTISQAKKQQGSGR